MREQLNKEIIAFNTKWMTLCNDKYNGDMRQMFNNCIQDILEDTKSIWELTYKMNLLKEVNHGSEEKY